MLMVCLFVILLEVLFYKLREIFFLLHSQILQFLLVLLQNPLPLLYYLRIIEFLFTPIKVSLNLFNQFIRILHYITSFIS